VQFLGKFLNNFTRQHFFSDITLILDWNAWHFPVGCKISLFSLLMVTPVSINTHSDQPLLGEYLPSSTRVHRLVSAAGTDCARFGSWPLDVHAAGGELMFAGVVAAAAVTAGAWVCGSLGLDSITTALMPPSFWLWDIQIATTDDQYHSKLARSPLSVYCNMVLNCFSTDNMLILSMWHDSDVAGGGGQLSLNFSCE